MRRGWMSPAGPIVANAVLLLFALPAAADPGDLDPSFHGDGRVTTGFGSASDNVHAIEVQSDSKIVAGGESSGVFALARYETDGSLDASFGVRGRVLTPLGTEQTFFGRGILDMALQPDGKIVAVGTDDGFDFVVARYDVSGSLDLTFDSDGWVVTRVGGGGEAHAVAIQPDGKILVAGGSGSDESEGATALVRYEPDGSLDPTFGSDGKAILDLGAECDDAEGASDIGLQSDGQIVAVGTCFEALNHSFLASVSSSGALERIVTIPFAPYDPEMVLQTDDKVVVAGTPPAERHLLMARYSAGLDPDPTFGTVRTALGCTIFPGAVAIQADGRIVIGGIIQERLSSFGSVFDIRHFGAVRYQPDGRIDASFGRGGRVRTPIGSGSWTLLDDLALQDDGKIVAGGTAEIYDQDTDEFSLDFALARYLGGGEEVAVQYRPDAKIALGRGEFIGNNVYNSSGEGQTRTAFSPPGGRKTFRIRVENDGDGIDCLTLMGPKSGSGFRVRYFAGTRDVTRQVQYGVYSIQDLDPGEGRTIKAIVTVEDSAPPGARRSILFTAASAGDPSSVDAVKARIRVTAP
jgi:uncharacterized delta-60 repeat protein